MADAASWSARRNASRRLGGMSDALSLAADLGLCAQVAEEGSLNAALPSPVPGAADALVKVLRDLTSVQRKLVELQVELQGRQEDERTAHLTHVSEIERKSRALQSTTETLKDVIQNKDRIIARLQQPYSLDCIPVETEYQKQFSELLSKAAGDYGALSAAMGDLQWSSNFKDPPTIWGELLRPIPAALASCTRYYEAISSMREAVSEIRRVRTGSSPVSVRVDWASSQPEPETVITDETSRADSTTRAQRPGPLLHSPLVEQEWRTVTETLVSEDATGDSTQLRRLS